MLFSSLKYQLFLILFLCSSLFVFTACENPIMAKILEPIAPQKHTHDWGEWIVITEPTCTTDGEKTRVCNLDPTHIETRPIAALGHAWGEWAVITEPTCTTGGERNRVCARDQAVETRPIAALGHAWGEWTVITAPTCTMPGEGTRVCAHDPAYVETGAIAALGHAWGNWIVIIAPACTTAGEEARVCARDLAHVETRLIAALGHDWGEWIVTKAPTKTEEGEETKTCAHDPSHTETRSIARLGEAGITVTFTQIAEGSPSLGEPVTIYRSSANGQTSYTFTLDNPEQYASIAWYVYSVTGSGETFTLSSSNIAYNIIGKHVLTLEVVKGGLLYTAVITFEVRQ